MKIPKLTSKQILIIKIILGLVGISLIIFVAYLSYQTYKGLGIEHKSNYSVIDNIDKLQNDYSQEEDAPQDPYVNSDILQRLENRGDYYTDTGPLTCPANIQDAIKDYNASFSTAYRINERTFRGKYNCNVHNEKCDDVDRENLEIQKIIKENEYNIVGGCLYNKEESALPYNLLAYLAAGFFGSDIDNLYHNEQISWNYTQEWFRYQNEDKLYIFLYGVAGCGGCVFNGPYLIIDLESGDISGHNNIDLPYLLELIIAPSGKYAVRVGDKEELYLYSLIDFEQGELLFQIPSNKTVLSESDGIYPIQDAIQWVDDNTISVQLYKKTGEYFDLERIGEPVLIRVK